jgi:hypothetical protein
MVVEAKDVRPEVKVGVPEKITDPEKVGVPAIVPAKVPPPSERDPMVAVLEFSVVEVAVPKYAVPETERAVEDAYGSVFAPVAVEVMVPLRAIVLRYEAPDTVSAVVDAYGRVLAAVALETMEPVTAKPASVPKRALLENRFVDEATVEK